MSELLRQQKESFSLAAGAARDFSGQFDFIHYDTLPAGVTVELNGTPPLAQKQGAVRQGEPGKNQIDRFRFVNTTAGSLDVVVFFGTGTFTISGEVALSGSFPLPAGASTAALQTSVGAAQATAAKQDTAQTRLNLLATEAKQDTGNTSLATLAAAGTETARGAVVTNATTAFNGKKSVSVANRSTSTGNVTVTFSDSSTLVLLPGEGAAWSVTDRLNTLTNISVTSPDATTYAVVATTA